MAIKGKYLERYGLPIANKGKGRLLRDYLLVEVFEDDTESGGERKTAGGIHIPDYDSATADYNMLKSMLGVVVEVGEGYVDEQGNDVPLDIPLGAVVWFPVSAVNFSTTIPGVQEAIPKKTLALVSAQAIRKIWNTQDDYKHDKEVLDAHAVEEK